MGSGGVGEGGQCCSEVGLPPSVLVRTSATCTTACAIGDAARPQHGGATGEGKGAGGCIHRAGLAVLVVGAVAEGAGSTLRCTGPARVLMVRKSVLTERRPCGAARGILAGATPSAGDCEERAGGVVEGEGGGPGAGRSATRAWDVPDDAAEDGDIVPGATPTDGHKERGLAGGGSGGEEAGDVGTATAVRDDVVAKVRVPRCGSPVAPAASAPGLEDEGAAGGEGVGDDAVRVVVGRHVRPEAGRAGRGDGLGPGGGEERERERERERKEGDGAHSCLLLREWEGERTCCEKGVWCAAKRARRDRQRAAANPQVEARRKELRGSP
jgi:hypothetical protein